MAHSVAEAAARAVKNSQRVAVETRTSEEIIKTMRNNLTNPLAILKSDVAVLMSAYDDLKSIVDGQVAALNQGIQTAMGLNKQIDEQAATIADLQAKLDEFRAVYDAENQSTTVQVVAEAELGGEA